MNPSFLLQNCYVATTNVWAHTGISGVPVGTHCATPVINASGCPLEVTMTEPTIHIAVTHGPLPAGGTKAQPATAYGAAMVATGIPETSTCGLGAVGIAMPP
jgi:hypothetical protein